MLIEIRDIEQNKLIIETKYVVCVLRNNIILANKNGKYASYVDTYEIILSNKTPYHIFINEEYFEVLSYLIKCNNEEK